MATAIKSFNFPLIEMENEENNEATMSSHTKQLAQKGYKDNGVSISSNMNASNIRTKTFFGKKFYYTIRGKKTSEAEGLEYESPLSVALENASEGDYAIMYAYAQGAKEYRSYGSILMISL